MARTRLPYRFIEDERRRKSTFGKRLGGIKKKTMELSMLCGIPVVLICTGSADNNLIETWPENPLDVQHIIERFGSLGVEDRDRRKLDLKSHVKNQIKKMSNEHNRLRKANDVSEYLVFKYGMLLPEGTTTSAAVAALETMLAAVNARIGVLMENMKMESNVKSFSLEDYQMINHWFDDQIGTTGLDEILNLNPFDGGNGQNSQLFEDVTPLNMIRPQLQTVEHYNNGEGCSSTTSMLADPNCVNYGGQDSASAFFHSGIDDIGIDRMMVSSTAPALPPPPYHDNQMINMWRNNSVGARWWCSQR